MAESPCEIDLVERVFLKIVLAESDDKFQSELNTFLAPVLLKLATSNVKLKNKVLELLTHINKRLKSRPSIELPLKSLLAQYMTTNVPAVVHNFTIIYIKMGYERLSKEVKLEYIPKMFECLIGKPDHHQNRLLLLVLLDLNDLVYPENINEQKRLFPFLGDEATSQFILGFFMDFLLLPYDINLDMKNPAVLPPPSFSKASFMRMQTDPLMTKEQVESAKLAILRFLCSDLVPSISILPHLVIASSDGKHLIADKGEHAVKISSSIESWENKSVIHRLLQLYQGTLKKPGDISQIVSTENIKLPSSLRLKLKIFPFFLKSKIIADVNPPICLQIIFEGLFGEHSNQKIKYHALELIHHISLYGSGKTLAFMTPLFNQALSRVSFNKKETVKLRVLAINGFAKLARCSPNVIRRDISIVEKIFATLTEESNDIQTSLLSIIPSISKTFESVVGSDQSILESLLLRFTKAEQAQIRLGACRLAIGAFATTNLPSRFALLLLAGDGQENIKEEAVHTLFPRNETPNNYFPKYDEACYYLFNKVQNDGCSQQAMKQVLEFLKRCLFSSCEIEEDEIEDLISAKLKAYFKSVDLTFLNEENIWKSYIGNHLILLGKCLSSQADFAITSLALNHMTLFFDAIPQICSFFLQEIKTFQKYLSSPKEEIRNVAAQVTSSIACAKSPTDILIFIKELLDEITIAEQFEKEEGKIQCTGYIISRYLELYSHSACSLPELESYLTVFLTYLFGKISTATSSFAITCSSSIHEVCRFINLPFPNSDKRIKDFVDVLCEKFETTKVTKLKESVGLAMSSLCIGDVNFEFRDRIIEVLFRSAQQKHVELHFTIGECLSSIGSAQLSKAFKRRYDNEMTLKVPNDDTMTSILHKIFKDIIRSPLGNIRQAGVVWLLTIVRLSSSHDPVQKEMKGIQKAFMHCLCDSDEITQDVASRGLSLVYEKTLDENKQEVIELLINSFMHGNKQKQHVEKDSKIFEEGALGLSPDGAKLSTYKELCSLATSMNKPDLMYKFMSLANHNAIWNSKKGAAFGIKAIADIAGEEIKPYIGKMIPKLYRYQYDPNSSLKRSMSSIWSVIVTDEKNTIATYWKAILQDLLVNITSNVWRTRESCCLAMKDLIKTIPEGDIVDHLAELWKIVFKVLDDIKESVRKAAASLVKTLSQLSIRLCDGQNNRVGEKAIGEMLEILLIVGIVSPVDEVKAISIHTLVQIAKHGGKLLAKHVAVFIPAMLDSLSGLEPQAFNTLRMQLSGQDQSVQDKLDTLRVSSANTSPMMEAVNLCLVNVNSSNLGELVPRLCTLLKSGLGITTKVGTARFLASLALHCKYDMQPYSGKLLSQLLNGVKSSTNVIKSTYSSTIGSLIKYASESTVEKVILKIQKWYLETEDRSINLSCALCVDGILKSSQEYMSNYGSLLAPLVFVAMQQEALIPINSNERKYWSEIWDENTPGNKASIKLYMSEIITFIKTCLESPMWELRENAARAIIMVIDILGSSMSYAYVLEYLKLSNDVINGRNWTGKVLLLGAIQKLCIKCRETIFEHIDDISSLKSEIFRTLLAQCNKKDFEYKLRAIDSFTQIIESWEEDYLEVFIPIIDQLSVHEDNDDDNDEDDDMKENEEKRYICVITSIGRLSCSKNLEKYTNIEYIFTKLMNFHTCGSWNVLDAVFIAVNKIVERTPSDVVYEMVKENGKIDFIQEFFSVFIPVILKALDGHTLRNLKVSGLKCLKSIYVKSENSKNLFGELDRFDESIGLVMPKLLNLDPDLDTIIEQIKKIILKNQLCKNDS